jgi:hypothetical protein
VQSFPSGCHWCVQSWVASPSPNTIVTEVSKFEQSRIDALAFYIKPGTVVDYFQINKRGGDLNYTRGGDLNYTTIPILTMTGRPREKSAAPAQPLFKDRNSAELITRCFAEVPTVRMCTVQNLWCGNPEIVPRTCMLESDVHATTGSVIMARLVNLNGSTRDGVSFRSPE